MMKWRVRRESRCNSIDHEDIRRSLEVLDKVLAEFDDCCDAWETSANSVNGVNNVSIIAKPQKVSQENTSVQTNGNCHHYASANGNNNYVNGSSFKAHKDGATSQALRLSEQTQQPKSSSPPPVPRRSPRTKLSERNSIVFTFTNEENNNNCDSLKSHSSDVDNSDLSSSFGQVEPIRVLSAGDDVAGRDDDVFSPAEGESESKLCASNSDLEEKSVWVHPMEPDATCESSFAHKRQMFENKIAEASRSPQFSRKSQKSSRRTTDDGTRSEPTSLCTYSSSESGHYSSSSMSPSCQSENSKPSPKSSHFTPEQNASSSLGTSPPKMDQDSANQSDEDDFEELLSSSNHAPHCKCKERLRRLDEKFAETRRLLKLNKIKELTTKPPDFVPPPPPSKTKESKNKKPSTRDTSSGKDLSVLSPRLTSTPIKMVDNPLYDSTSSITHSKTQTSNDQLHSSTSSKSLVLSETIEDLPNLLPTDALNRPHLGLSYSLEEDLCPGVKEIRQISPKSDSLSPFQSSPNMTKELSSLSTFSQSASSLGYVSSQSDLELNSPMPEPETKIPVSSLKSHTLPPGIVLNPSPFYSDLSNDTRDDKHRKSDSSFSNDVLMRSASAPPPVPQPEMDKKKHKRIFSKRERKKNDDNLSVKSDLSLDEGIIIKKFETLDGTTCFTDADKKEPGGEKKRSVWKSILRRK